MNKVILITGASSGIGEGIVHAVRHVIEAPDSVDTTEITIRPAASAN